jgi:integrase
MQDRISLANARLKNARVGVSIQQMGDRLYLQATLPPRPDRPDKTRSYQQRIALSIHSNPAGLALAEKEARKVGALLDCKQFSWEPYLKGEALKPQNVGDWLTRFEAEYRETVKPITWKSDYQTPFRKLDSDKPLTADHLRETLFRTQPNSKTRRRCTLAFNRLAEFAGVEVNLKPFQGTYSSKQVEPRDLPDDATIAECFYQIKDPGWRWVYGVMATFGLRNHECFYLDTAELEQGHMITVLEGKTGRRLVWACYPEWVDAFDLRHKVLPNVTAKSHDGYGQRVTKFFARSAPFEAYNLRHRWAVRTLEFGLPYQLAAKQMGHSVKVHEETYHRWITAETHQRAYEALMLRSDRPLPPVVSGVVLSV